MSIARHHAEWLSLLDVSGPFLSMPVLLQALPHGLNSPDSSLSRALRQAYDTWTDNQHGLTPDPAIHRAWVRFVLIEVLGYDSTIIEEGAAIPETLKAAVEEQREIIRPDLIIRRASRNEPARLLIHVHPVTQSLEKPLAGGRWKASPATRMMELLRSCSIPLGLVTNGNHWMLVHAPPQETTSFISWYASFWLEEPITLRSFRTLLEMHRFYGVAESNTLERLFAESMLNQQEVTDQLGYQVRQAVEMLVQTIDRLDKDTGRTLLRNTPESTLYEAALTIMMRLVFLFCAEERGLLRLGERLYDDSYAVSTLRASLRESADRLGEDVIERRYDAWCRLLAVFRLVHDGVLHHELAMPAYGGSLFDPDRYPFLEGRTFSAEGSGFRVQGSDQGFGFSGQGVRDEPYTQNPEASQLFSEKGITNDETTIIPRSDCVAEEHGSGGSGVSPHPIATEGRDVCTQQPDAASSNLDSVEHRGGLRETASERIPQSSFDSSRVTDGSGNADPNSGEAGICPSGAGKTRMETGPGSRAIAQQPYAFPGGQSSGEAPRTLNPEPQQPPPAIPLKVDNRTVLHLLEALQILRVKVPGGGPAEPRYLSFRALDIEQIGHVYEGLLDHTARRSAEPMLGLIGTKDREPEVPLSMLESLAGPPPDIASKPLLAFLKEQTGSAENALRKKLNSPLSGHALSLLRIACDNNNAVYERVRPFSGLVRWDTFERPVIITEGSVYVTSGTERRATGTHYTPRSLTEEVVKHTLEPMVYHGPSEGLPRSEWTMRPPEAILTRTVCDMAMGSGAFLVQACRYLAERLVEAEGTAGDRAQGTGDRGQQGTGERAQGTGDREQASEKEKEEDERFIVARRLVANRCLYGVDKNPLAVEIAKLSLWLITLQKDKPFTFLDHALKCGDSLLGVSEAQLTFWNLDRQEIAHQEQSYQLPLLKNLLDTTLDEVRRLRRQIAATPVLDIRDAEEKANLLAKAEQASELVLLCGDLLSASGLAANAKERQKVRKQWEIDLAILLMASEDLRAGRFTEQGAAPALATFTRLRQEANALLSGNRPFHWELEFPEVFQDIEHAMPYFAAIVGNPPFMGGKRITGELGTPYRNYLVDYLANGKRGSADLCAYFFLRTRDLLQAGGMAGLLATNTIAQGDTREVGLDQLTQRGYTIPRAISSRKWPGGAAVEVAHVWLKRGQWNGEYVLNDTIVERITPYLTVPGKNVGNPHRLAANRDKSFIGSYVLGMGFILEPEEAQALIAKDPRNKDVLFPYLNGEDLNSRPDQSPSRWVINFFDWPFERASAYPDCLNILTERVKPQRDEIVAKGRQIHEYDYWKFWDKRLENYAAIAGMERVLVTAIVSKYVNIVFQPADIVFMHKLCVFPFNRGMHLSILQSTIHTDWAYYYSSTLGGAGINYSPSDVFETFPFPPAPRTLNPAPRTLTPEPRTPTPDPLQEIGERYHEYRRQVMLTRQEGLTKTYNRFHDAGEKSGDIEELRRLHVEMDRAVADAYGWGDLELGHGFHETRQGMRYTVSEEARRELLDRLLALNHERYAGERERE